MFHLYSFIKLSKNKALRPFLFNFLNGCHGNDDRYENLIFNFLVNIFKLLKGVKFDYDQIKEENFIGN